MWGMGKRTGTDMRVCCQNIVFTFFLLRQVDENDIRKEKEKSYSIVIIAVHSSRSNTSEPAVDFKTHEIRQDDDWVSNMFTCRDLRYAFRRPMSQSLNTTNTFIIPTLHSSPAASRTRAHPVHLWITSRVCLSLFPSPNQLYRPPALSLTFETPPESNILSGIHVLPFRSTLNNFTDLRIPQLLSPGSDVLRRAFHGRYRRW